MKGAKTVLSMWMLIACWSISLAQTYGVCHSSTGEVVNYPYFSLSYLEKHEQAQWVSYYVDSASLQKVYKRKNSFRTDTAVTTLSASYADYTSAPGYDAGHLLPCRQMQFDCAAMQSTFLMSNMSPQVSAFNRYQWAALERLERNMAYRNGGMHVVTGPVLSVIDTVIGRNNRISVPRYFYKVFYVADSLHPKMIAFVLPNSAEKKSLHNYVVTVDSVEQLTGIDFFMCLPPVLCEKLEGEVVLSDWSFKNGYSNFGYSHKSISCGAPLPVAMQPININTASVNELELLPGIGPAKAQAIVEGRPYEKLSDLTRVKGIGEATLHKIGPYIFVE